MATYYVDLAAGNDTTGDGSSGTPWLTLHKALDSCAAGDTINVRETGGEETLDDDTVAGTSGSHITIQQWSGETQALFTGIRYENTSHRSMYHDYIGIDSKVGGVALGVPTLNTYNSVYLEDASYITFTDCSLWGSTVNDAFLSGLDFEPYFHNNNPNVSSEYTTKCDNITFTNCDFKYGYNGIKIQKGNNTTQSHNNWVIDGCTFDTCGEDHITMTSVEAPPTDMNAIVRDCTFNGQQQYSLYFVWTCTQNGGGWSEGDACTQATTNASMVFWKYEGGKAYFFADDSSNLPSRSDTDNILQDADGVTNYFSGLSAGDSAHCDHLGIEGVSGVLVENSIFKDDIVPGLQNLVKLGAVQTNGIPKDITIQNCIFTSIEPAAATVNIYEFDNVVIKHCIFDCDPLDNLNNAQKSRSLLVGRTKYSGNGNLYLYNNFITHGTFGNSSDGTIYGDYNIWEVPAVSVDTDIVGGTNDIAEADYDDYFTDRDSQNYTSLTTSPGIGAATLSYTTTEDILGNTRPSPNSITIAPDIGPYEHDPLLLDETFEATGYDNTSPGWTETASGGCTVDEDASSSLAGNPTSWGSKCLQCTTTDQSENAYTQIDYGSEEDIVYVRIEFVIGANSIVDTSGFFCALRTSGNLPLWYFILGKTGVNYRLAPTIYSEAGNTTTVGTTVNLDLNTRYVLEVKWDQVNKLYEWKLNGTSIDSGSINATATLVFQQLRVGVYTSPQAMTAYFDNIQVRDDDWCGYEPNSSGGLRGRYSGGYRTIYRTRYL